MNNICYISAVRKELKRKAEIMNQRVSFACRATEKDENGDSRNIENGTGMDTLLQIIRSKIPMISDHRVTTIKNIIYVVHHELVPGHPCIRALIEVGGLCEGTEKIDRTVEWNRVSGLYQLRLFATANSRNPEYEFTLAKLTEQPLFPMQSL